MSIKKICISLFICLSLVISMLVAPSVAVARDSSDNSDVSKNEALAAALYHVKFIQALNVQCLWKDKNVKALEPIEVFDTSDELHSYIVNLETSGVAAGYVEIGNNKEDYPVLSYSYDVNNQEFDKESIDAVANSELVKDKPDTTKKVKSKKVVCMSPGSFGLKVDYTDDSADLIFKNEKKHISSSDNKHKAKSVKGKNHESKKTWDDIDTITKGMYYVGEIGTDSDGVTDNISFEYNSYDSFNEKFYASVPNTKQYYSSLWTGPSGCAPTSAYNVLYYWHYMKGKSNLLKNKSTGVVDKDNTILLLRNSMQTNELGFTDLYNQSSGILAVARYKGYSGASSTTHIGASWSEVKSDLSYGPSIISMNGHTFFGDHALTGVGYIEFIRNGSSSGHQYIETHDNSQMTTNTGSVYIAYGRDYSILSSINFNIN